MNAAEDGSPGDQYVKDFFLDHFRTMSIREELSGHTIVAADSVDVGSCESEPPVAVPISSCSHFSNRLSVIPLTAVIQPPQSSTHHTLIPAVAPHHDSYEHSIPRSVVVSNVKRGAAAVSTSVAADITIYEKNLSQSMSAVTPSPASHSPTPPDDYYHSQQTTNQNFHHSHQPLFKDTANPSTMPYDPNMIWIHDNADFHRYKEPLDLRGPYMGETISAIQNWNVMQQHTSVITDGSGKRILHDYSIHHQRQQLIQQPPLPLKPAVRGGKELVSSQSTGCGSTARCASTNSSNSVDDTPIDDKFLINMSVRDLNKRLKGWPREQQEQCKKKRRTLKNRIYARNCRTKRVEQKDVLQSENHKLQNEKSDLISQLQQINDDIETLQRKLDEFVSKTSFMNSSANASRNIVMRSGNFI